MGLDAQEAGEAPDPGGGGAVSKESTQQEAQGGQAGEARTPEQYSMKKALSGERAGAASLAML